MNISNCRLPWLTLLFSFAIIITDSYGQTVNFEDGFEDGDFTVNPAWSGDVTQYAITTASEKRNYLLQLQGDPDNGGTGYLSTPSADTLGSWEFFIRLDFAPSGSNKAEIFLMSDIADLEGPVNGYALRAGESGSDDVFHIVRYDGGNEGATVLSGTSDISNGGAFRVNVTRHSGGVWRMEVAEGYEGIPSPEGGTQTDATYSSSSYFGIHSTYTSSRHNLFYYDFKIDLPPFTITDAAVEDKQVDLTFNRAFDQNTVQPGDFAVSMAENPVESIAFPSSTVVQLTFSDPLPSGEYTVEAQDIEDQHGNTIADSAAAQFIVFGNYTGGDIIINEFMYDPPSGQSEYVEIKNRSGKFLNLQNWQLSDGTHSTIISGDTLVFPPGNYLVLSPDTSALFDVQGTQPYIQSENFPSLNNDGDSIKIFEASGNRSDSLTYTPDWGGSGVALERRSASIPGYYLENWGDSPADRSGTPGEPNKVPDDESGPVLTELTILSSSLIKLGFNERLDPSAASEAANYSLSGNDALTVTATARDSVLLELDNPLQNAQSYTLAVSNIEDIFANVISARDTTFTYYEITAADSGSVFINEFNYQPAPGETEYVEIYNASGQSFDLQYWSLSDNRGSGVPIASKSQILPPESHAVLAPDSTLLETDPGIKLLAVGPSFPALNNSGDEIVLKNRVGTLLDSLQYTSDWTGEGNEQALERRTTAVSAVFEENWGSAAEGAGSPGRPNTIPDDQTPPEVVEWYPLDESELHLVFSERVNPDAASEFENYQILPNRTLQQVSVQSDTVTLSLAHPMTSGETYTLAVSGIPDIFGNRGKASSHEIEYLRFEEAGAGDIILNEIMAVPAGEAGEFVELYNPSDKNIDISGWSLGDGADEGSIPPDTRLRADSYLILTGSTSFARKYDKAIALTAFPTLNNNGDALFLKSKRGLTIDSLRYLASWMDKAEGHSLERKDPLAASNDSSNWKSNLSAEGHSAGLRNANFEEDDLPPQVVFANAAGKGLIEVYFNEFIRRTGDLQFTLNEIPLDVSSYDTAKGNRILLKAPAADADPASQTLTVENLTDMRGNMTANTKIQVARPPQAGDLVINEIMFLPIQSADDLQAGQGEYVELLNTRRHALSLEGLLLHDAPDENGGIRLFQPVSSTAKWVSPGETVLVYADPAPVFSQSRIAAFFDMDTTPREAILRVDRSSLGLATEDAVYIADSTGGTIDSVHYSETWHNPNLADSRGIALERISPGIAGNSAENWGSSVHPKGGTPGTQNTLYQERPEQPTETGITFSPNPFSPDGDGYEDNLVINYKLGQSDYLLRVHIFDRYGRHIKELADGKPAGFTGSLTWDGRRDDGRRNRIGIYIIVFEAYDSASGRNKAFKETVVLARKLN